MLRFGLSTEIIASARGKLLQQGLLIASVEVVITFLLLSVFGLADLRPEPPDRR